MNSYSNEKKGPKSKVETGPGVPCKAPPNEISKNLKKCVLNYCCQWHPQLRARLMNMVYRGQRHLLIHLCTSWLYYS